MNSNFRLTLTNDFHNTEATVLVRDGKISGDSYRRAERKLCGIAECTCGSVRGVQRHDGRRLYLQQNHDGRTGKLASVSVLDRDGVPVG